MIPLMILNAIEGKDLPVYGDGRNIRDWLFVKDHCKAVWKIMKNGACGETYNIGGNCEMKNIDLVEEICDLLDKTTEKLPDRSRKELITFVKDRPGHDLRYAIDCSKIINKLNWKPEESFKTGINKTLQWYISNRKWVDRVKSGEYRSWIKKQYK
jgi:dTDP-glucose 4,6-dehydratase